MPAPRAPGDGREPGPGDAMEKVTEKLIVLKKDGVGRIAFDNQQRRNALTYEMWQGLPVVLKDFAQDAAVRVIVLSGAGGRAFSAGADISEFEKQRASEDAVEVYNAAVADATNALVAARKPLIAQIDGFCIGGGLGVAMCCDLRIAATDSRFAIPAAKLGLGYKLNNLRHLIDVVGPSFAMEILFTARQFDAEAAADAVAVDLGDHRLPGGDHGVGGLGDGGVVDLDRVLGGALLLELRDVGAGRERLAAGAGQHDHAHFFVAREVGEHHRQPLPHVVGKRVAALLVVEGDAADAVALLDDQPLGHRLKRVLRLVLVGHAGSPVIEG